MFTKFPYRGHIIVPAYMDAGNCLHIYQSMSKAVKNKERVKKKRERVILILFWNYCYFIHLLSVTQWMSSNHQSC